MKLTPELLLSAYCQGVFPMANEDEIDWYDPDPRAIIPLDTFHVPRRLARTVRSITNAVRLGEVCTLTNSQQLDVDGGLTWGE